MDKLPAGTRGATAAPGFLARAIVPVLVRIHHLTGNKMQGMELLYLTTVGARSGQHRTAPLAHFDSGQGGWLVVASAGGTATHPGWYHNIVANADQVWAEVDGKRHHVSVEQLAGEEREQAWQAIVGRAPRFDGYQTKTDRQLPVLRLTPLD